MVRLPWQKEDGDQDWESADDGEDSDEPLVSCDCQDGTISVHEDQVRIERTSRSKYDDKRIPMDGIVGVEYSTGIVIGYIQIEQTGVENSDGGVISSPVDENTLHFGHGVRDCAGEARDAILERAAGDAAVERDGVE